jgi:hypothetical protein
MGKQAISQRLKEAFVQYWRGDAKSTWESMIKDGFKVTLHTCEKYACDKEIKQRIAQQLPAKAGILEKEQLQKIWSAWVIDPEIDMPSRLSASDKLAKSKGMYIDKIEHQLTFSIKDLLS